MPTVAVEYISPESLVASLGDDDLRSVLQQFFLVATAQLGRREVHLTRPEVLDLHALLGVVALLGLVLGVQLHLSVAHQHESVILTHSRTLHKDQISPQPFHTSSLALVVALDDKHGVAFAQLVLPHVHDHRRATLRVTLGAQLLDVEGTHLARLVQHGGCFRRQLDDDAHLGKGELTTNKHV